MNNQLIFDKIITICENNFDVKCRRRKIVNESIDEFRDFVDIKNIKTNDTNNSSDETKTNDVIINDFVFRRYSTNLTNKILQIFLKIDLSIIQFFRINRLF